MKISKSKSNNKPPPPQIHLILIQSKIPFGYIKTLALGYYSHNFTKSNRVKCSLYFISPMKISKSTEKPPKIHLILIQSKIPFGYVKTLALGYYSHNFTKSNRVKCSLYFISPMKISKSTEKPPKIHSILIQSKIPFWLHIVNGI